MSVLWLSAPRRELAETTQKGKQREITKGRRGGLGESSCPEQRTSFGEKSEFTWRRGNLYQSPLRENAFRRF